MRTGMYAIARAPRTLDAAIDYGREELGPEAPGADLLFSRPYEVLMVDWQICIEDGSRTAMRSR